MRDVLTPIVDLHYLAPSFFHLSDDLYKYLRHILSILWDTEWKPLESVGVEPVQALNKDVFDEMRWVKDRVPHLDLYRKNTSIETKSSQCFSLTTILAGLLGKCSKG